MADNIERREDGGDSFVEYGTNVVTAWHRKGTPIVTRPKNLEELERDAPWLFYPVEKRPCYIRIDNNGQPQVVQSNVAWTILRSDRNIEFGRCGSKYEPVNNRDVFVGIDPLMQDGLVVIETGGVLRDGAKAWLLGAFAFDKLSAEARDNFGDLGLAPYVLFLADHTGTRMNRVANVFVKVVCENTEQMAVAEMEQSGKFAEVAHTPGARDRMIETTQQMFQQVIERYERMARVYKLLLLRKLPDTLFESIVLDNAVPDPRKHVRWNPDASRAESVIQRYIAKREFITTLRWSGKSAVHRDGNAWEAYGAVTEALDHNEALWPARNGAFRTASMMHGTLQQTKERVFRAVLRDAISALPDVAATIPDDDLAYALGKTKQSRVALLDDASDN